MKIIVVGINKYQNFEVRVLCSRTAYSPFIEVKTEVQYQTDSYLVKTCSKIRFRLKISIDYQQISNDIILSMR